MVEAVLVVVRERPEDRAQVVAARAAEVQLQARGRPGLEGPVRGRAEACWVQDEDYELIGAAPLETPGWCRVDLVELVARDHPKRPRVSGAAAVAGIATVDDETVPVLLEPLVSPTRHIGAVVLPKDASGWPVALDQGSAFDGLEAKIQGHGDLKLTVGPHLHVVPEGQRHRHRHPDARPDALAEVAARARREGQGADGHLRERPERKRGKRPREVLMEGHRPIHHRSRDLWVLNLNRESVSAVCQQACVDAQ
mmetsp:Transcript_85259/g.221876  ORF Transcript_85259/g.221876 Transcript_85259/m.221876 type:complete len:253 (-) Transcript_85259:5486-6244(-)